MSFDPLYRTPYTLNKTVSIPLEQGNVFRPELHYDTLEISGSLNPFGTGQCLSTITATEDAVKGIVSIPLEQGNVFRR